MKKPSSISDSSHPDPWEVFSALDILAKLEVPLKCLAQRKPLYLPVRIFPTFKQWYQPYLQLRQQFCVHHTKSMIAVNCLKTLGIHVIPHHLTL